MQQLLKTPALSALALALAVAGAVSAEPLKRSPGTPTGYGPVKVQVVVSARGLDLSSDAGADQFLSRLSHAVSRACDDRPKDGPRLMIARSVAFHACRAHALEEARNLVRSPAVKRRIADLQIQGQTRLARR